MTQQPKEKWEGRDCKEGRHGYNDSDDCVYCGEKRIISLEEWKTLFEYIDGVWYRGVDDGLLLKRQSPVESYKKYKRYSSGHAAEHVYQLIRKIHGQARQEGYDSAVKDNIQAHKTFIQTISKEAFNSGIDQAIELVENLKLEQDKVNIAVDLLKKEFFLD